MKFIRFSPYRAVNTLHLV